MVFDESNKPNFDANIGAEAWGIYRTNTDVNAWVSLHKNFTVGICIPIRTYIPI